jgi:uncharacterized membrane protein YuzA (DUF378 family)
MLMKLCVVLAAFGAINWMVLSMFDTDAVRAVMGDQRTTGTDALRIVVAMGAVGALVFAFQRRK